MEITAAATSGRKTKEQRDNVLLCLEERERINGEKMMALGRRGNSDKVLFLKKVSSSPLL